jgi:glycosyltransferase involved in cell wall biosynthesis
MPLITVGIPFRNNQSTILEAVHSIICQTVQDWEMVLIDDGSNDDSVDIARRVKDSRVRVVADGIHKGLPARLNQIIEMARGKFIARMDADDLCSPKRFEAQLKCFDKEAGSDVVGTGVCYLDQLDRPIGIKKAEERHSDICRYPWRTFGLCHASTMFKTTWSKQHQYSEKFPLAEDFELWLRTHRVSVFTNVPRVLYFYRLSSSYSLAKQLLARKSVAKCILEYGKRENKQLQGYGEVTKQMVKLAISVCYDLVGQRELLLQRRYDGVAPIEEEEITKTIALIKGACRRPGEVVAGEQE